jgi:hypothetical protein
MTRARTGRTEVLLPQALNPAVLDRVIRHHIEAALARTGEWPATIQRGPGAEHSPGVVCWPVVYTTTPDPRHN